jgi:hypothetical protein
MVTGQTDNAPNANTAVDLVCAILDGASRNIVQHVNIGGTTYLDSNLLQCIHQFATYEIVHDGLNIKSVRHIPSCTIVHNVRLATFAGIETKQGFVSCEFPIESHLAISVYTLFKPFISGERIDLIMPQIEQKNVSVSTITVSVVDKTVTQRFDHYTGDPSYAVDIGSLISRAICPSTTATNDILHFRWIVNEKGEIGVRINDINYYGYKGESFVYDCEGEKPRWRYVEKRECGESIVGWDIPSDEGEFSRWAEKYDWNDQ